MDPSDRPGEKSPTAFRTITEVATELDLPQHVLRFWETKFPQIKPLKRRGGRRYYRPEDIAVLRRVRSLLHAEGYTIKGAQKLLRERTTDAAPPVEESVPPAAGNGAGHAVSRHAGADDLAQRKLLRSLLDELEEMQALLAKVRSPRG